MATKGKCALCEGELVHEKAVYLKPGGQTMLAYTQAWVCTQCGAAWPIALRLTGPKLRRTGSEQLWKDGVRAED